MCKIILNCVRCLNKSFLVCFSIFIRFHFFTSEISIKTLYLYITKNQDLKLHKPIFKLLTNTKT